MMKIKYFPIYFTLIIFGLLAGCDAKIPVEESNPVKDDGSVAVQQTPETLPVNGSYEGDTINLYGKFVLFYGPERGTGSSDSLSTAEIEEFLVMSTRIRDSLSVQQEIFSIYTTVNHIRIYNTESMKPMVILRNSFNEPTGMIVSDGRQSPVIKKGTGSESDFRAVIKQVLNLPS